MSPRYSHDTVTAGDPSIDFSLLGGPLHRVGARLGLVWSGTNTVPLGIALGIAFWVVLVSLATLEGAGRPLFTMPAIAAHARLLLAVPLFFLCETLLYPRMHEFVHFVVSAGVVRQADLPAVTARIASIRRLSNSWLPEALYLVASVVMALIARQATMPGIAPAFDSSETVGAFPMTSWWYWVFVLALFRFLLIRCLWQLGLWCYFLWRLSRIDLNLIPTHPDRVAGLGMLENAHVQFVPLILALSVVVSASLAGSISAGHMEPADAFPIVGLVVALDTLLFLGPLLMFWRALVECRYKGLIDYMTLASRYVSEFERKWLDRHGPAEPLLGTGDVQALADLSSSLNVVREMQWAPVSRYLLVSYAMAAVLPMVPLLLFKYPLGDLGKQLFARLIGL